LLVAGLLVGLVVDALASGRCAAVAVLVSSAMNSLLLSSRALQ
jgi:hypothetical protein